MKRISTLFKLLAIYFCFFTFFCSAQTPVPGGNVSGTWTLAGAPYNVTGHITIPVDSTLIIQPGVNVVFQGHYKFNVQGRILAIGNATDTIVFTAANTTTGWWGMRFDNTPSSQDSSLFMYCKIQYGIATNIDYDAMGGALFIMEFSKIRIDHCSILNCTSSRNGAGIFSFNSSPIIANCLIKNNNATGDAGGGICCLGGTALITNNIICYNSTSSFGGGIYSSSSSIIVNNIIINNTAFEGGGCMSSNQSASFNVIN